MIQDTQWPRFEVFKQDRPGKSHEAVGSVHAVDAEMALQNGRDVFVRRPQCHSLWVAPADAILAKTAAELTDPDWAQELKSAEANRPETFLVFQKQTERRGMTYVTHVGEVQAASPVQALQTALNTFDNDEVFVWWVCPARAITKSGEDDVAAMFAPALDKKYRMPNQYRTVTTIQKIKREGGDTPS